MLIFNPESNGYFFLSVFLLFFGVLIFSKNIKLYLLKIILNSFFILFLLPIIFMLYTNTVIKNANSSVEGFFTIILSCLLLAISLYMLVYIISRKRSISVVSFLWFLMFITQYYLFTYSFYLVFFQGLEKPIYLQDISIVARYRYVILLFLSLVVMLYLIMRYFIPKLNFIVDRYNFAYIKEEIRQILYLWNDGFMGDISVFITDHLYESLWFKRLFFVCHFIVFYLLRILGLAFFINFCFFHGDLRFLFYFSFISFGIWLLSFLDYYLLWFLQANINLSNEILYTSFVYPNIMTKREDLEGFIEVKDPSEVKFQLTPEAEKYGFTSNHLAGLSHSWYRLNNVLGMFKRYKNKSRFLSYFIFGCYILCWAFIVKLSFWDSSIPINEVISAGFFSGGFFKLFSFKFRPTQPLLAPRDARYLQEWAQNRLRQETGGAYSPGHPVYGEQQPDGSFAVEGQFTKGSGSSAHPSHPLLPHPIDAKASNPQSKAQGHIPFGTNNKVRLPLGATKGPIPGSEQVLEQPEIKAKIDQDNNT